MDIEEMKRIVKANLSDKRYAHTLRVTKCALTLAERFDVAKEKVQIAALFHDYAKDESPEKLRQLIKDYHLPETLLQYHDELWHGPVAAKWLEQEKGITDQDILNAIYYHTTGRSEMSDVELVVFVADYIEPARDFPGVDTVRALAKKRLELAAYQALKQTITFLVSKEKMIHPNTFYAYNNLTKKVGVK
ncbi:MAG TPA: bis(5'-nucleosyl)-tetraphosphatase (symmetrical) YqeK [Pseudogracilibacillus sp.]|nr:bis(5'-nucleosyl)-tetraphosphatase (symmetrical) YqeK [Pseudogracilibacillus sp.]